MSNAIIKQQGDSPIVADNIWEIRLGAVSFILGVLAGTLVTAGVGRLTAKSDAIPKPPTPRGWPLNFVHRGGAKVVPENTIEGFREGFALGGGVVECDVHASAEGTIVVIHDAVVDRTTDGTGPVAEKTLPELQSLDAGYRFSPDGGATFPWRAKGVTIPTLKALYEAFPNAPFNIEIKGDRASLETRSPAVATASRNRRIPPDRRQRGSGFGAPECGQSIDVLDSAEHLVVVESLGIDTPVHVRTDDDRWN